MAQYLNINEWFEESEKLEAEMKANEAIAFGMWLTENVQYRQSIISRATRQLAFVDSYILVIDGELDRKTFYTTEELYKIFKSQ